MDKTLLRLRNDLLESLRERDLDIITAMLASNRFQELLNVLDPDFPCCAVSMIEADLAYNEAKAMLRGGPEAIGLANWYRDNRLNIRARSDY